MNLLPLLRVLAVLFAFTMLVLSGCSSGGGDNGGDPPSRGPALTPDIDVSPTNLNFASVAVGATSAPQTVTVTNNGTADLTLGVISTIASPFSRTGGSCTNNQVLAISSSCTITIIYSPTSEGDVISNFNIPSDDPDAGIGNGQNNVLVGLTGNGALLASVPNINVSPIAIDFGTVNIGNVSADQTVTVTNNGAIDLVLGSIGTVNPPFNRAGGTCVDGQVLTASSSCTIIVNFAPSAIQNVSTGLYVPSNDPDTGTSNGQNNVRIELFGRGVAPNISVSATLLDFREVIAGTASDELTVDVSNDGNNDLILGTIGAINSPFSRTGGTCVDNQVLAPSTSCSITVQFAPTVMDVANSSFNIPSNDPDGGTDNGQDNVEIALYGFGDSTCGLSGGGSNTPLLPAIISDDGGGTTVGPGWDTASSINSGIDSESSLRLTMDSNGNAIAVWIQSDDVMARRFDALTRSWTDPIVIDSSADPASNPALEIDSSGNAIVVWNQ